MDYDLRISQSTFDEYGGVEAYLVIRELRMKSLGCSAEHTKEWSDSIHTVEIFDFEKQQQVQVITR